MGACVLCNCRHPVCHTLCDKRLEMCLVTWFHWSFPWLETLHCWKPLSVCVSLQHGPGERGADAAGRSSDSGCEFVAAPSPRLEMNHWLFFFPQLFVLTCVSRFHQDINLKMAKNSQALHFQFREDKQWKLQQVLYQEMPHVCMYV